MKVPTIYITNLTAEDQKKLTEIMKYDKSLRVRMRAHSVLLSKQGYSIDTIADIYQGVRAQTVGVKQPPVEKP